MVYLTRDQLLDEMLKRKASDAYITVACPIGLRTDNALEPIGDMLGREQISELMDSFITPAQRAEFEEVKEFNSAYAWEDKGRFRINLFYQQGEVGMVIRQINTEIPTFEQLDLPSAYENLVMEKRGLVLIVGPTGSGKSSSLAAMIGHRNANSSGHIITVEDPIEFQHQHQNCIITQRDVGVDTLSFQAALKNALRQRPDLILIGEIRDRETMEHAINFAETGHLCLATLHANNCPQAIERILSFFNEEKHRQVLMNLALNLKGILSQRLVLNHMNGRSVVSEILLNEGLIREQIELGNIKEMRTIMERNHDVGMQTFDQALLARYLNGQISKEVALAESDQPQNLQLKMKQAAISPNEVINRINDSADSGKPTSTLQQHLEI